MPKPPRRLAAVIALIVLAAGSGGWAAPAPDLDLRFDLHLGLDRGESWEFRVPPGHDVPDVPGARTFPIPGDAGGGLQVTARIPADPAAAMRLEERLESLQARGEIADLQITPCRKFLPGEAVADPKTEPVAPHGRATEVILGTAGSARGGKLGPAAVLVHGPAPDPPGIDGTGQLGWTKGVDDRGAALGFPDVHGRFFVPWFDPGPRYAQLAPVCNCATTAPVDAGSTTSVPASAPVIAVASGDGGASSAPGETPADICYCGPDMGAALTAGIARVHQRVRDLPDSEKGAFDGPLFMNRNADAFDAVPAPRYKPGVDPAEVTDRAAALLCPSGHCIKIEAGQSTFWLAGRCLPRHMSNEILAAFVAAGLEVPFGVFQQGANMRELVNNHGLEGTAPVAAYQAGYALHDAIDDSGSLTQAQVEQIVGDSLESSLFGYFHTYTWILKEYPTLAHCQKCPDETPGAYGGKDFTRHQWTLDDGTKVGGGSAGSEQ